MKVLIVESRNIPVSIVVVVFFVVALAVVISCVMLFVAAGGKYERGSCDENEIVRM